jgi:hypothetical protein
MAMAESTQAGKGVEEVICAAQGCGPLLQREYRGVIVGTGQGPEEIATTVRRFFPTFAPSATAVFRRDDGATDPLEVGDELDIRLALIGRCRVRVAHVDERSLTLATLKGHPEAGRITFGAYRDERGRIVFQIRSRTRANGYLKYLGYFLIGKQMQSRTWINFIWSLARAVGGSLQGPVQVATTRVEEEPADRGGSDEPTFSCGEAEGGG